MTGAINGHLREITRRTALGALGAGIIGASVASWPRLSGTDIPGRGDNSLSIAILGTAGWNAVTLAPYFRGRMR